MAVQERRNGPRAFVRVRGADLARAALAASVLLVLWTYVAWRPFANSNDSPLANWIILWGIAAVSAVGAVSTLRSW